LEWDAFLRTQPEAIWERVRAWHEVLEDPQSHANGYITRVDVPGIGPVATVGNLVTLSETPGSVKGGPPLLGEANAEILGRCGFSTDEINTLTERATSVREAAFAVLQAAAQSSQN
jgi:crotonobetainyl-CoA:carnitine CoA-transferase CaiB-like acyl-CoA transferase